MSTSERMCKVLQLRRGNGNQEGTRVVTCERRRVSEVTSLYEVVGEKFTQTVLAAKLQGEWEDAMFEQEVEMESKQGGMVPLLLIVTLIVAIVGVAIFYVMQSRQVLTNEEARPAIIASLKDLGPVTIHFETGVVKASVEEKPRDPNYRLFEKNGLLKLGKDQGWKTPVSLTPKGEAMLAEVPGVQKSKDKDGADIYVVPVAERQLVDITKITMNGGTRAVVEFTWKWNPNKFGHLLDASGAEVKSFNTWDRATLIDKYGAKYYHAEPQKAVLAFAKGDKGWQIVTE